MTPDQQNEVAGAGRERAVAGGATLCREGHPADALFMTLSGRLKLTQVSAGGDEVVLRFAGPGDVFGGLAVLDGGAYPFSASAVEPARVLCWTRRDLGALFTRLPALQRNVLAIVGDHGRQALDRARELATEPVPRRLARALQRLLPGPAGEVLEGVRQQDLAHMAGTTLFTVSRTLAEWQRAGIVEAGRGRLVVRDPAALAKLAEG